MVGGRGRFRRVIRTPATVSLESEKIGDNAVALKLKTYEGQARASVIMAVLGGVAAVSVIYLLGKRFDTESFYVTYGQGSLFLPAFAGTLLFGLAAGATGFIVALNSAGRRRNTDSKLSWQGFFLNALVLTIILSAGVFFFFTRNAV